MTTDSTLRADLSRHVLDDVVYLMEPFRCCRWCHRPWPCDASRALAALTEAEQERDLLAAQVGSAEMWWLTLIRDHEGCHLRPIVAYDEEDDETGYAMCCDDNDEIIEWPSDLSTAAASHDSGVARRALEAERSRLLNAGSLMPSVLSRLDARIAAQDAANKRSAISSEDWRYQHGYEKAVADLRRYLTEPVGPLDSPQLIRADLIILANENGSSWARGVASRALVALTEAQERYDRAEEALSAARQLRNDSEARESALRGFEGSQQQRCKSCGRADGIDFGVSDVDWEAIAQGKWNVLCLVCFDQLAVALGREYQLTHLVFAGKRSSGPDREAALQSQVGALVEALETATIDHHTAFGHLYSRQSCQATYCKRWNALLSDNKMTGA